MSSLLSFSVKAGALVLAVILVSFVAATSSFAHAAGEKGTVKITVVDISGSQPSNVTLTIRKKGVLRSGIAAAGTVITFGVEPGTYVISYKSTSKYKTWGGDCSSSGEVVIVANTQANCTLSNAQATSQPPTSPTSSIRDLIPDIRSILR